MKYRRYILLEDDTAVREAVLAGCKSGSPTVRSRCIEVSEFPIIDCTGCGSRCCYQEVRLTQEEADRLKELGAEVRTQGGIPSSPNTLSSSYSFGKEGELCVFSLDAGHAKRANGYAGCSIHKDRPQACKDFDCRVDTVVSPVVTTELLAREVTNGMYGETPCNELVGRLNERWEDTSLSINKITQRHLDVLLSREY